jgi:very-short-patch-repair endonuclease
MTPHERKPLHAETEIRALMRGQLGLITTAQARESISEATITRRVQAGHWARLLPGVYRDTLVPTSLEQSCFAANLWGGADAVIARKAAGALWQLDGLAAPKPELWVPKTANARSKLVAVHRGAVAPNDRRMLGPITLTSPARTLVDLAAELDDEDLTAVVEDAMRRGLTTPTSVRRCVDAVGGKGRPGTARLRAILDDRNNQRPTMSRLEVRIWRTLRAKGLNPVRQHPVQCATTTYWIDCAFPQWRVAVEGFGDKFHRSPRKRRRELRRLADLATVHWRVLPVTWDEIADTPDDVIARIITTLAA